MKSLAISKLSKRQCDCLRLVAQLKKTEQIADHLGIAPSTVNTHIERAVTILGVSSRREAALMLTAAEAGRPDKLPTEIPRLSPPPEPEPGSELPTTARRRPRNDLTSGQRFALAVIGLVALCIALAGLGAAIEQLSDWRAALAHG